MQKLLNNMPKNFFVVCFEGQLNDKYKNYKKKHIVFLKRLKKANMYVL